MDIGEKGWLTNKIIFFIFLTVILIIYGLNLFSWWGVIDDHQIVQYLGTDQNLRFNELLSVIGETEIVKFGNTLRYRPSYYVLRVLETFIWGSNVWVWYLFRIFSYTYFCYIFFSILKNFFNRYEAFFIVLLSMLFHFWGDIFARLGPAEFYCVLGTALLFHGFLLIYEHKLSSDFAPLLLMVLGCFITVGSKENFVFVPILFGYLIWILKEHGYQLKIFTGIALALAFGFSLFVILGFLPSVLGHGKDIYNNSASISIFSLLKLLASSRSFVFAMLTLGIFKCKGAFKKESYYSGFVLILLFLFQVIFYRTVKPFNSRYDYPGLLVLFLIFVLVYKEVKSSIFLNKLKCLLFIMLFTFSFFKFINPIKLFGRSYNNFSHTIKFKEGILQALDSKKSLLVIEYGDILYTYEPSISVAIFLRSYNFKGNIYLRYGFLPELVTLDPFRQQLLTALKTIHVKGNNFIDPYVTPNRNNCLSILLGVDTPATCDSFVKAL